MNRYEAHIEKDWQEAGFTRLLVARFRDNGRADFGVFLVDVWCLGVKEAFSETDVPASELGAFIEETIPADLRERIHPSCAKKLVEGAVAYASSLGFAPHRSFRKAGRVMSGLSASDCPTEFVFGRDGRPCYAQGQGDSEERVDRVLAILDARFGRDGYEFVGLSDDDAFAARFGLIEWLNAEPPSVPRFFEFSGMITAMLICPEFIQPLKVLDVLWGEEGRAWRDEHEAQEFFTLLMEYWNHANDLILAALEPGAPPDGQVLDIWEKDFAVDEGGAVEMALATHSWAVGFHRVTRMWPEAWSASITRPDLAPHWEVIGWWAEFEKEENTKNAIAHAESGLPRTLNESVLAIARAFRPAAPPH